MDRLIQDMLTTYEPETTSDYENALKEIMQEVVLLGLWRSKFFDHAAFYGGTALRILYNLDRFSEDLDFSLLEKNTEFTLDPYLKYIHEELHAFGFEVELIKRNKSMETAIDSAFLKANTQIHLMKIGAPEGIASSYHGRRHLKIKFEVDTNPPLGFSTEIKHLIRPIPFWVKTYKLSHMFSGKMSAVLCRQWQDRVKGRDWYDFLWFVQNNIPLNLSHLETRLREAEFYTETATLDEQGTIKLIKNRIEKLNVQKAKEDIARFIKHTNRLDGWSKELFQAIADKIIFE